MATAKQDDSNPTGSRTVAVGAAPPSSPPAAAGWWQAIKLRLSGSRQPPHASTAPGAEAPSGAWRYCSAQEIARGGMGIVYRVSDRQMDRVSAMKVALPYILKHPAHAERFLGEAKITGQLEHPNIVPVHDLGSTPENGLFYTMKMIDGKPLSHVLDMLKSGCDEFFRKYDRHQLLTIFRKVCDAVAFAHAHRIIHRDIKPENIMVGAYGEVLLMDWGLAKKLAVPESPELMELMLDNGPRRDGTSTGIIKGTPCYMSPEQACGSTVDVDCQTDIFLLGATLYHMITLVPPYNGNSADEVIAKAALGRVMPAHERARGLQVPEELSRIIGKAMAVKKKNRYAAVEELAADIDALMSGASLPVTRVFEAGESLMQAGDTAQEAYVITAGEVEVFRDTGGKQVRLGTLGPGDVVGEMALITNERRSATVVALKQTQVQVITSDSLKLELHKLAPWMGKVVNSLALRLQATNANVHPLILGSCERHVARQLLFLARECGSGRSCKSQFPAPSLDKAVTVISQDLALPPERVQLVIKRFLADQLVELTADGTLNLENTAQLAAFLQAASDSEQSSG